MFLLTRTRRVLTEFGADRNPGENLVPESPRQAKASARVGDREDPIGVRSRVRALGSRGGFADRSADSDAGDAGKSFSDNGVQLRGAERSHKRGTVERSGATDTVGSGQHSALLQLGRRQFLLVPVCCFQPGQIRRPVATVAMVTVSALLRSCRVVQCT